MSERLVIDISKIRDADDAYELAYEVFQQAGVAAENQDAEEHKRLSEIHAILSAMAQRLSTGAPIN